MRYIHLLLFLVISTSCLNAQNYYVAFIKGKVYYEDKLLKKKDKIKMKGVLRFTAMGDYLKVSGPGGLYTITPGTDKESSSEFLVAVKEEFFPKVRLHATSQQYIPSTTYSEHYFSQYGSSTTFLEESHLLTTPPELSEGQEFGFLHETSKGLFYKTAVLKDGQLAIREKDFSTPQKATLIRTAIVQVRDKSRWLELIQGKDSIAQIEGDVDRFRWGPEISVYTAPTIDAETGEIIPAPEILPKPAEILDFMGPPIFVNRKKMAKDLKFHLKVCGATDIETFLKDYEYESYIYDTYGPIRRYPDVETILRQDLKLSSQSDASRVPVID